MKTLITLIFTTSLLFANYSYNYGEQKGKIDMHGGKGAKLGSTKGFSNSFGLGSSLSKAKKKEKTEDKNYIPVDKIEKIQQIKE